MKKVLLSMAVLSSLAFASIPPQGNPSEKEMEAMFQKNKKEMLEQMESNHQIRMKCFKATKNQEDMVKCHEEAKELMEKQRKERFEKLREGLPEQKHGQPMQPQQPMKQ